MKQVLAVTVYLVSAQIDLEAYGRDIDFQQLQGLWRLIYTTALDVVSEFSSVCMKGTPLSVADVLRMPSLL